jgi:hypothetical protein
MTKSELIARLAALKHTAVAMKDVREIIGASPARAKVIVLDACHSGAAIGKAGPTMTPEFIQRVFTEAEGMAELGESRQFGGSGVGGHGTEAQRGGEQGGGFRLVDADQFAVDGLHRPARGQPDHERGPGLHFLGDQPRRKESGGPGVLLDDHFHESTSSRSARMMHCCKS